MRFITKAFLKMVFFLLPAAVWAQHEQKNERGEMTLPHWGIKSNLLYDATTTMNLGIEFRTGAKTSFDIPLSYNPWVFSNNSKWTHILVQPEFRWWVRETFRGSFFGLHGHYAFYNTGGLPNPPFSEYMNLHRFEGWLAGAGLSYGYRWNFNHRWALEATVGGGYAYLAYDRYPCAHCGEKMNSETKNYFGPTKAGVTLVYGIGGKKRAASDPVPVPVFLPPASPVAPAKPTVKPVKPVYEPKLIASYITPAVEAVKMRSEAGRAYLDFSTGRAEIVPSFKNNASELQRIYALTRQVASDPDATITGIIVTGYSSIEGTYNNNTSLSKRRAVALKEHLQAVYGFRENLFTVNGAGEDWATLDSLVSISSMPEKYHILEIIRSTSIFDGREKKLMEFAGGAPYRRMKADLFPQLRRVEYRLQYTVLPFTVEKGREVFYTKPGSLSLNEMFLIANNCEPGSNTFNELFETAARLFPQNDVANLNAAASALDRKDAVSAARYLEKIWERNPEYWNNLGILSWLQGNREKATACFAKGGVQGAKNLNELTPTQ